MFVLLLAARCSHACSQGMEQLNVISCLSRGERMTGLDLLMTRGASRLPSRQSLKLFMSITGVLWREAPPVYA